MQSAEDLLRALAPKERGRVIAILRSADGMTRDELAKKANVSPNTISDWEKGKVASPRELFARLDPVLEFSVPRIQRALLLIRAPRDGGEIAEAPPEYEPADEGSIDVHGMTSPEIEGELRQIAARIGQLLFRTLLLATERAVRNAQRPAG